MNIFIHIQQLYVVISHIHKFRFNDIFLSYEYIYLHSRHIIFIHFQGQNFYSTRLQYVIQHFFARLLLRIIGPQAPARSIFWKQVTTF